MRYKIATVILACFAMFSCKTDNTENEISKEERKEILFSITRSGTPYPDNTTFGFIIYPVDGIEPISSANMQKGTYRYTTDPNNTPYGNADHLIPCNMTSDGVPKKSSYDEDPLISNQYYDPALGIMANKGTNYIYMYTPAIPTSNYSSSTRIFYSRDTELKITSEPFIIEADNYTGSYEVSISPETKMVTMLSQMNVNFIQGASEAITISDVVVDNLGAFAYCHAKLKKNIVIDNWAYPDENKEVPSLKDNNNSTMGQISFETQTPVNVFPADYSGVDGDNMPNIMLNFKLTIGSLFTNVKLPLAMVVLPNKIYNININVTSELITFSYSYEPWNDNDYSEGIGDYDGSQISLGSFNISTWTNGNEGGSNQEDDIL